MAATGTRRIGEWRVWQRLAGRLRGPVAWLLAIVLLAAGLRFFQIGEPEVWLDEIAVRKDAIAGTNATVSRTHNVHLKPVGVLLRTVGDTPAVLRTWGALLSTLSVGVGFVLGTWLGGRRLGLLLAVLFAVNPYLVLYAQDGNYYSGMFLFASMQVAAFAALLRGAVKGGLALIAAFGLLSYYNHPMSICLTAILLAASISAIVVSPSLRAMALPGWKARLPRWLPGVVLGAGLAVGAAFLGPRLASAMEFVLSKLAFGGALTNVEFGFPFFQGLYTSWGVAHFRSEGGFAGRIAWLPFLLSLGGAFLLVREGRRSLVAAGLGWLCLLAPLATYAFIFNINVRRGFYIRYLTFLVPLFLLGLAVGIEFAARCLRPLAGRWGRGAALLPVIGIQACALFAYYRADLRNIHLLTEALRDEYKPGDLVWNADQWLRVRTWFPPAGLPDWDDANVQTTLLRRESADLYPFAFAVMAWERPGAVWVNSSWREAPTSRALALIDRIVQPVFKGTSAQGPSQDARLGRASVPDEVVMAPANEVTVLRSAAWPDHGTVSVQETPAGPVGYRERDGSWDFLAHGGTDDPLELVLLAVQRSARDMEPAPGKADQWQLDPAHHLAVAVDGRHQGVFRVPPGDSSGPVDIRTGISLGPGLHRVSVTGFNPRGRFTPFNPWRFRGIRLAPAPTPPGPASEDLDLGLCGPKPKELPVRLDQGWVARGRRYEMRVDNALPTPSGTPALRVDFPAEKDGSATLLSPPFEVIPGGTVAFSVHLSCATMTRKEALPCVHFFDESGRPLGASPYSLKPAITGSLWPGTWRRYAEFVPVPGRASTARIGVAIFPREISFAPRAGTLWVDAFAAVDADINWRDPVNPRLIDAGR